MDRIFHAEGLTVDLERICAIKENYMDDKYQVIVQYNARYTHSQNPFDETVSKDLVSDTIIKDYRNFEYTREAFLGLNEYWSEYLKSKK